LLKIGYLIPLLLSTSLWAVTVKSISFEGLVRLSKDTALQIAAIPLGQELNIEQVDEAIKALHEQRYFEDIWVEEDAGHLTIYVKEKPSIARIELEGVGQNDKDTILGLLGVRIGMMYDETGIEQAKNHIRQFFEAKGYFDSVVEAKNEPLNEDGTFVHERVTCRYKDDIKEYHREDVDFMDVSWGFNSGELKIHELPMDSNRIKDVYMKEGFLDAQVSAPFLRTYPDSFNASLSYHINEGEAYTIDSITYKAPEGLLNEEALAETLLLEEGETININHLRRDLEKIETMVADQGYAFVRVYPDLQQDKEAKKVNIVYNIAPGEKVYIRNVRIAGNSRTIDRVVRRELYLTEGNMYSRTDLVDSQNAIRRTGYFEDATIQEERVNKDQVDLLVKVVETNTGSISGGIGYGTSQGILLSASVSDGNIFGSGLKGTVMIERSDDELSGRISLTNPRVFDSVYNLGGSIYAEDNSWTNYDEEVLGFNISGGRKIGRYTTVNLLYTLEETTLSALSQSLIDLGYEEEASLKSSIAPSISYNNTDDYYLPRSGIDASTSLEYAGIGGDQKFVKNQYRFAYFHGFRDSWDYDLILRYKARFAVVWDNGELPLYERLYLGGINSIRGFDSRSISPKDSSGELLGGEIYFANSVEASFPLIERFQMRGALFFDYGMIGESDLVEETRASAGVSLEWISPLGPISLIFAEPLKSESGDDTTSFEFTIGRQF